MDATKFTYSTEDYRSAFDLHYAHAYPVKSRLLLFIGIGLLLIGAILLITNLQVLPYLKYIFLALGVFYLGFYVYRKKKIINNALKAPGLTGEHKLQIDSKGVLIEGEKGRSTQPWPKIIDIAESDATWLFYFNKDQFYIAPKRLYNQDGRAAIVSLIEKHESAK